MRYAQIRSCDISNGTGIGVSLFVQGCDRAHHGHPCFGCFNSPTWDPDGGKEFTDATIDRIIELMAPEYINHLSILGGEPLDGRNIEDLTKLLKVVCETYPNKTIWLWTGYDFDPILSRIMSGKDPNMKALLEYVDVLVDGQFVNELKDPSLAFRGSSNQRIIDVRQSLKDGSVIEHKID